jgi:NTE family protein
MRTSKTMNLALRGGGAYGPSPEAYSTGFWMSGGFNFDSISGTSAGAMNAVVLASGFHTD